VDPAAGHYHHSDQRTDLYFISFTGQPFYLHVILRYHPGGNGTFSRHKIHDIFPEAYP
jgi:hypothetical protein